MLVMIPLVGIYFLIVVVVLLGNSIVIYSNLWELS